MSGHVAALRGTIRNPSLSLSFPPTARHPVNPSLTIIEWLKSLPNARFDPSTATWEVTGTGDFPQAKITGAGFEVTGLGVGEFTGVDTLDALVSPVTMLADDGRTVLVRHRLAGYEKCLALIGSGAIWEKERRLFRLPVSDALSAGQPKPGVLWTPQAIDAAYAVHARTPLLPGLEAASARLGAAIDRTTVEDDVRLVAERVGHYPDWWALPPMAHQIPGALAVAAGHTLLADAPGVGKSLSALLAASLTGAQRILVLCPPVVATHWAREIVRVGYATEEEVAVIRAGKKVPALTDATKAVVMPDSMLTARPAFVAQTIMWEPDWIVVDEAHRFKNMDSRRTEALLDLAWILPNARKTALTGTPLMSGPHELVPILDFTGHLTPVFGGAGAFLDRYCRQDKFGGWHPDKRYSEELHRALVQHVWVRRTKEQVLPNLPEVTVDRVELTVDLADYRKTHADIIERIDDWVAHCYETDGHAPTEYDIDQYVDTAIQFTSWLRRAAGQAKVKAVAELVREHVAQTTENGVCRRPILVWAHHRDVIESLQDALKAPAISGSTSATESTALIDQMQAGTLPVLICSITAVGAGVTLTRSSDMIFAEMDWTPAMMQQALDRARRIGQKNAVTARIAIAEGTLDEHVSRILTDKALIVGAVLGDADAEKFATGTPGEKVTPASIIRGMIAERVLAAEGARQKAA